MDLAAVRALMQGASNSAASTVSLPVDALSWLLGKAGIDTGEAAGGSDWMRRHGLTAEAQGAAGIVGELGAMALPLAGPALALRLARTGQAGSTLASKSPKMSEPQPLPQRPFHDDYPQGATGPHGSRLAVDIEGNPLTAPLIVGRRAVAGMDEGVRGEHAYGLARDLGVSVRTAARHGPELKGDAGRYVSSGPDKQITIDKRLPVVQADRVFEHELSHALEDFLIGKKMPTAGIERELAQVYSDLNSTFYVPKGKVGATPQSQGYRPDQHKAELVAEAFRAYRADPNYFKTVAPQTAKRIREVVNKNQNLNPFIQFHALAGLMGVPMLGYEPGD